MKPFKITIETLDYQYVVGGAMPVQVIECDGYFLVSNIKREEPRCTTQIALQGYVPVETLVDGLNIHPRADEAKTKLAMKALTGIL